MENQLSFTNDYYVISSDYKLISFNDSVANNYPGIKVGDFCYAATMKRDTPCMHCPIAGNSDCDCPIYFDPFYNEWIEAIFSHIGDDKYAVCCRPAKDRGLRVFDSLGKEDNDELVKKIAGGAVNNYLDIAKEQYNKMILMLNVLSKSYGNIFLINRTTKEVEILKLKGKVHDPENSGEVQRIVYDDFVKHFSSKRVHIDDILPTVEFLEWENINSCLEKNDSLETTYKVVEDEKVHRNEIFFKSITDSDFIICGTRNVDSIIAKEEARNAELIRINAKLEESTCEQEAQIEEIAALNTELMDSQARLEEVSAEQEAQIEEITQLNQELEEAHKRAQAANEAKSTFLFNMSHDIRTPMNAIMGYNNFLKRDADKVDRVLYYQDKIEQASEILISLLNNVLDLARIESGKLELDTNYNHTGDLIDSLLSVFESRFKEKNIKVTYSTNVQHEHIMCDHTKIREIFSNLISNAIKYTPEGGYVNIHTEEVPCEREGFGRFKTTVEDSGIGMSEQFLPKLFESFARERNTTTSGVAGTGLGMAIVKELVDMMGGTIEVESKLGAGTKFTVTLTHLISPEVYYSKTTGDSVEKTYRFHGKRILLAEDNSLNAEIATIILQDAGFEVEVAQDGVACVDMVDKADPCYYDAILMDIQMPYLDGYQASTRIRRMEDPVKNKVPIIAMTANAFEEDKRNAFAAGMNDHVAKPIRINELMKTMSKVLK